MSAITSTHNYVRKDERRDGWQDAPVDVQLHARKDDREAGDIDRRRALVIVLANHKRGVTKTTSTANLGAMFAEAGLRVLLVDCDPQANLSETFGWSEEVPGERLEDLLARPAVAHTYAPPIAIAEAVAGRDLA